MTSFLDEYLKLNEERIREEVRAELLNEIREEARAELLNGIREEVRAELRKELWEDIANKTAMQVIDGFLKKNPQMDAKEACEVLSFPYQKYLNARATYA